MPKIFICYRREDNTAAAIAGRVYDRLTQEFGPDNIFMDVDNLKGGSGFVDVITKQVAECDALVAMIGEKWLTVTDEQGARRLDNPEDRVRLEIATALKRDIQVIPALVYQTPMPRSKDLPQPLKKLARRRAVPITHEHFHRDTSRLIDDLRTETVIQDAGATGVPNKKVVTEPTRRTLTAPEGTWIDPDTNLMWIVKDNGQDINWNEAIEYAKNLRSGGYSDWRLPTIEQLKGLYDPKNGGKYNVKRPVELTGYWVWSSESNGSGSALGFIFGFGVRYSGPVGASGVGRALCVRVPAE